MSGTAARLAGLRWLACWRTPMEEVRVLDYAHSSLYDVPGEVFLYERTLEELILDSNRIKDLPRPLFHCHGLKTLCICDNDLVSLPEAICDLVQLQYLDVSRNALTSFPDSVNACKRLAVINVSCNPLLRLPEGITQLISLQELYLNDTDLEFIPANVGRLSKLRVLEVRDNRLATLPTAMARLKQLQRLDIGHNEFQGWPDVVAHLTSLTELLCDLNELTTIPPWIGNLQQLSCLDASNNRIQVVAPELGSCFKLCDLRLSYNELQCLPHTLGQLKNLITLKVDHNYLERLPDSIGSAEVIEEIVACHNNIEALTPQVGLLRKLRLLNLDDNRLEEIPPELGSCKNLRVLSVRQNELTNIPPELGHLPVIRVLNLADNHLHNLPVSILNLMSLQALWLSDIQSSPLVQLHQEFDAYLGRRVLTGILLPQQPTHNVAPRDDDGEWSEAVLIRRSGRIRFSQDLSDDEPGVLLRAPTPYPKELRMLAKQARNMVAARAQVATLFVQDPVGSSPSHSSVNIKEAKVKRPQGANDLAQYNQVAYVYSNQSLSPESRELEAIEVDRIRNEEHAHDRSIYANGQSYAVDTQASPAEIPIQDLSLEAPNSNRNQRRPITREESFRFCREEEASQVEVEGPPCNENDCACEMNRVMEVRAQRVIFEQETQTPRRPVRRQASFNMDPYPYHYQNVTCQKPVVDSIYNNNVQVRRFESVYGTCRPQNGQLSSPNRAAAGPATVPELIYGTSRTPNGESCDEQIVML